MTWTYSGDPSTSPKDEVRFLLGDTDTNDQLIQDEEIEYLLTTWEHPILAASYAAEQIATGFTRHVSISGDGMSWSGGELADKFWNLADALRARFRRTSRPRPYAGGLSKRERELDDLDDDLEQTAIRSKLHDHPETSGDPVTVRQVDE